MILYLLSIISCLWASLCRNRIIGYYVLFFLLLFLCFGYMTGSDWRSYEVHYNAATFEKIFEERFEIGYGLLESMCNALRIDFWTFHIGLKICVFISLCRFINYFKVNLLLFWALFLPEMGFFLFIDCPFRNLIALGFFSMAIPALFERRANVYFFFITLAVCFHSSAFILFFIYFLWGVRLKSKYWIVLFVIANIIAYDIDTLLVNIFSVFFSAIPFLQDKLLTYVLDENFIQTKLNVGTIYRTLLFILFLFNRSRIENGHKYGTILFYLSMIYFVSYPFTISLKIFSRFSIYLLPFCLLTIIVLLNVVKNNYLVKYAFISLLLLWTFVKSYTVLTADSRYIPYSNYLQYIMKEKPSYRYRSNYNISNSIYGEN